MQVRNYQFSQMSNLGLGQTQHNDNNPVRFTARLGVAPILAGNWKMNAPAVKPFFSDFVGLIKPILKKWLSKSGGISKPEVLICPPNLMVQDAQKALKGSKSVKIGVQNFHQAEKGAFTGEVSIPMLKEKGIETSLIGHSERRTMFAETNKSVNAKVLAALEKGINPIVCCGESEAQKMAGKTDAVIAKQIKAALKGVEKENVGKVVIAYEPIWAIGTGKTCNPEDADKVMGLIRNTVSKKIWC